MAKAPAFLKQYFWDIDFKRLDISKSSVYVIERILELGDIKAIKWVLKTFKKDLIKKVVMTRRGLSPRTANFWASILGIDNKEITCLQGQYLNTRQTHWPY